MNRASTILSLSLLLGAISLPAANEQQTTGVQGAPDATTTIDSRYLPPLPQKFDGQINLNAAQSKPAWLARVVPPKGAPNILLSLADDVGFDEPPTFGDVKAVPKLAPDDVKKFEAANRDAQ